MPKVLPLIQSCNGCPNRQYYSGGKYECKPVGELIPDSATIPSFCPLPDYPARQLADMEHTIRRLREPNAGPLIVSVLSHVAAKFRVPYGTDGTITFTLDDGSKVYMRYDSITRVDVAMNEWCIHFRSEASEYSVVANQEPLLRKKVTLGGGGEGWQNCRLAQ